MAKKTSSNVADVQRPQTRSSSKAVKTSKAAHLNTPPPEADSPHPHPAPEDSTDQEAPQNKAKKTPKQRNDDSKSPTLQALSVNVVDDVGEMEPKEMQQTSPVSDKDSSDDDLDPDSPMTHSFSRDPLTGQKRVTKATLYCPMNSNILMYLPALSDGQKKRLLIKSGLGKEFSDKKSKLDKKMEKDNIGNYIKAPNRISPAELTKRGIKKEDLTLRDAGYQVPKDGIPASQLSRRNGRLFWKYDKKHPNAWCLVTRNNVAGEDGEEKDVNWIVGKSEWTRWKGGSSEKEIEEVWAASGIPI